MVGKIVFLSCAAIFFLKMATTNGVRRLIWFLTGIIFFQNRIILLESPTVISFDRFLIFALLFIECGKPQNFFRQFKKFPFFKELTMVLIGMLAIGLFDFRHNTLLSIYRILDEFIQSFLICFLCYVSIKEEEDLKVVIKFLLYASIILGLYGIFNYVTRTNPLDTYITQVYDIISPFHYYLSIGERFRINSFVSHPIYYGYLSAVLLMVSFYSFLYIKPFRRLSFVTIPIIFINLIFANSRTSVIVLFVGLFTFTLLSLKPIQKLTVFFVAVALFFLFQNVTIIKEKFVNTSDIFTTGGKQVTGSNVQMRTTQLEASYSEFLKSPLYGNGLYYINEDLGWNNDPEKRTSNEDFEGFESYIYHLLIEQGLIGIIINIVFFTGIISFFLQSRSTNKEAAALGLSLTLMFLTFIIGTGTVDSWVISMGLIGIVVKYLQLSKENLSDSWSELITLEQ